MKIMKTMILKEIADFVMFDFNAMKEAKAKENIDTNELPTTVRTTIGDTEVEFTPAFTDYSMEQPKKKESLLKNSDADKRMDVIFHFATPDVFWNEGVNLFDRNGKTISKDTPNVLVACDMADTYWRIFLDDVLANVQIHQFESVQEYAQVVGNSVLLSRGLSNVEKVGYSALATGNEAYREVFCFAKRNNVPMNTAQLYLDLQLKPVTTNLMLLGKEPKTVPTLGRTPDIAQALYEQNEKTFSRGGATKRYAIRVENNILKNQKYSFDELMEALKTIPADEIAMTELQGCAEKELCIMETLSSWMIQLQRGGHKKKELAPAA